MNQYVQVWLFISSDHGGNFLGNYIRGILLYISMNHKIRKIKEPDLKKIVEIENTAYGKYGWSYNIFKSEILNSSSIYLASEINQTDKLKIIGYIGAWLIQDEGHITTLVVDKDYRRQHYADILLYTLIHNLLKYPIRWITLEVKVSNTPAINLYKKFLFNEIGIRKHYYQDNNEDALILWSNDISNINYIQHIESIFNKIINADK